MKKQEVQEITSEDVGDATEVVAEAVVEKPETPLEQLQRGLKHLQNTKAWALAKVDGVTERIEKQGGEVPAAMKEVIEQIRKEAA